MAKAPPAAALTALSGSSTGGSGGSKPPTPAPPRPPQQQDSAPKTPQQSASNSGGGGFQRRQALQQRWRRRGFLRWRRLLLPCDGSTDRHQLLQPVDRRDLHVAGSTGPDASAGRSSSSTPDLRRRPTWPMGWPVGCSLPCCASVSGLGSAGPSGPIPDHVAPTAAATRLVF